jgi:hypothetical protein
MGLLYIIYIAYFGIIILLFLLTINKRRNLKIAIPTGIIFTTLVFYGIYIHKINQEKLHIASIEYLGDYRLNSLDGKSCENCKVRLLKDYTYQIIVQDKIMGFGNWNLGSAPDIPNYFLEIENGPNYVITENERLIDYINRKKE